MNRKIINIIMFFIIIQGIFAVSTYCQANSEKVNLSVSSATAKVGDEVSIDINLNNNSNFVSANLILNYDTEELEYVSYTEGKVLKEGAMKIVKNNSETGKVAIGYVGNPTGDETTVESGNILKIVFKVKTNFEKETNLKLECTSLKDKDGADIASVITNGKIEKAASKDENSTENKNEEVTDNEKDNNDNKVTNDDKNNNNNKTPNNSNNNVTNNSQAQTNIPHAGISEKIMLIMTCLILLSIFLYKKSEYIRGIR